MSTIPSFTIHNLNEQDIPKAWDLSKAVFQDLQAEWKGPSGRLASPTVTNIDPSNMDDVLCPNHNDFIKAYQLYLDLDDVIDRIIVKQSQNPECTDEALTFQWEVEVQLSASPGLNIDLGAEHYVMQQLSFADVNGDGKMDLLLKSGANLTALIQD